MNNEEYNLLTGLFKLITVGDLVNKEDRVLLYGYTVERNTWVVELIDGEIQVTEKLDNYKSRRVEIRTNHDYIPSKRVYPLESDYEFCKLLLLAGIEIPFLSPKR